MISDKELVQVSQDIDNLLANLTLEYKINPLSLAGITLARLIHLTNHSEDFYTLMKSVGNKQHLEEEQGDTVQVSGVPYKVKIH